MAELPFDNNMINLRDLLADLYLEKSEAMRVVQEAGLKARFFEFKDSPINNWYYILNRARLESAWVDAIIDVAIREQPPSIQEKLKMAKQRELNIRGEDITKVEWTPAVPAGELERITGRQSTLLPITFLEMGLLRARAIARLDLGERGKGTGFLISDDLLLTNHHVLEDADQARAAVAQFNYQQMLGGLSASYEAYELDPLPPAGLFHTSLNDDWSVVRVKPKDGQAAGQKWGCLTLSEQDPKKEDFTIIIQHPSGGPKQIALYHNIIAYVDPAKRLVQYLTDTEPGSSGSPVFDTQWNVIALHHSGGWLREQGGDPKQKFYRNEGIHVNTVIAGLKKAGVM